jgi:hypothetical protein
MTKGLALVIFGMGWVLGVLAVVVNPEAVGPVAGASVAWRESSNWRKNAEFRLSYFL